MQPWQTLNRESSHVKAWSKKYVGNAGMKHMQAHFERMGRLDISDPPSEPPQAANDCEPTVARSPGVATSPALASSPESVGMRIPAALCWSLSPRSKEPSADGRTSADGQTKRQGAGGKLLQRLRSAARRAVRFSFQMCLWKPSALVTVC